MRYSPTRTEPQKPAAQGQDRRGGAARSMGKCVAPGTKPKSQPRRGKNIVCIIPSFGERYLSTALYANLWEEAQAQTAEPLE